MEYKIFRAVVELKVRADSTLTNARYVRAIQGALDDNYDVFYRDINRETEYWPRVKKYDESLQPKTVKGNSRKRA